MDNVKFYSEHDLACGWELAKVIERINNQAIDNEWSLNDLIEFYNILKYLQVKQFVEYIQQRTGFISVDYKKKIEKKVGIYLSVNKANIVDEYDKIDFIFRDDFFEILERYKVLFFASTFCRKLQVKNTECCIMENP